MTRKSIYRVAKNGGLSKETYRILFAANYVTTSEGVSITALQGGVNLRDNGWRRQNVVAVGDD